MTQGIYHLAFIDNANKLIRRAGDDLFTGQGSAAAFDQLPVVVDFVCTIHVYVDAGCGVEIDDLYAVCLKACGCTFFAG